NSQGRTLAHYAVANMDIDLLLLIQAMRLNLRLADNQGKTPPFMAIDDDHRELFSCMTNHRFQIIDRAAVPASKKHLYFALNWNLYSARTYYVKADVSKADGSEPRRVWFRVSGAFRTRGEIEHAFNECMQGCTLTNTKLYRDQ
ncbi:MAG: hypothetical protein ACI9BD_000377, partial [Candidatus Marinamargulisbacteria bacterium]